MLFYYLLQHNGYCNDVSFWHKPLTLSISVSTLTLGAGAFCFTILTMHLLYDIL